MSVTRTDYVIFGVDVGYDNVDYEEFEAEICGESDAKFRIIYDGMSGNYAYAGCILAQGDEYEGFGDGVVLSQGDESLMAACVAVIHRFPKLELKIQDFKMIAVSHFR